jgi:hypothetical protein
MEKTALGGRPGLDLFGVGPVRERDFLVQAHDQHTVFGGYFGFKKTRSL